MPQGIYSVTASATGYTSQTQPAVHPHRSDHRDAELRAGGPDLYTDRQYTAGHYNLVSWPDEYSPLTGNATAFTDIFGPLITTANPSSDRGPAYIYNSAIHDYIVEPNAPADGLHLGRGYFIYLQTINPEYTLLGTPPAGATVTVPLEGGAGAGRLEHDRCSQHERDQRVQPAVPVRYPNGTTRASNTRERRQRRLTSTRRVRLQPGQQRLRSGRRRCSPSRATGSGPRSAGLTILIPTGGG